MRIARRLLPLSLVLLVSCAENPLLEVVSERVRLANATGSTAPTADKAEGLYFADILVALSSETEGARIFYTLDGSTPTSSTLEYEAPIAVSGDGATATIKAIALKDGGDASSMSEFTYEIKYSSGSPAPDDLVTDTTPDFDWDDAAGAETYRFQLAADDGFADVVADYDGLTESECSAASILQNERDYWWRVAAFQNGEWSEFSEAREFRLGFGRITVASPSDGAYVSNPTPTIDWEDAPNAASYQYHIVVTCPSDPAHDDELSAACASSAYAFETAIDANQSFADYVVSWSVRAKSVDGTTWGDWSDASEFTLKYYSQGDTGPAGGVIIYDKGVFSDGWRYLEAAPDVLESQYPWGNIQSDTPEDDEVDEFGMGYEYTETIVSLMESGLYAARVCWNYECAGFDDWYLPSLDEAAYLTFATSLSYYLWTSNEVSLNQYGHAWVFNTSKDDGGRSERSKYINAWVLPIRRF